MIRNGFFNNTPTTGYSNRTVQNITVSSSNSTLAGNGGWIGQRCFGTNGLITGGQITAMNNIIVKNCHSNGDISGGGGGILGSNAYADIKLCSSSGKIGTNTSAGGICGINCIGSSLDPNPFKNTTMITSCSSVGDIGIGGGGIVASSYYVIIKQCVSYGTINYQGGGIIGSYTGANIINCYSNGNILNGISKTETDNFTGKTTVTIYGGGGLIGANTFYSVINESYSLGSIGIYGGGIVGNNVNYSNSSYTKSKSMTITNCYSQGYISNNAGGIIGEGSSGFITVNNCYSSGPIDDGGFGIYNGFIDNSSTYTANGLWVDADANIVLTESEWFENTGLPYQLKSFVSNTSGTEDSSSSIQVNSRVSTFTIIETDNNVTSSTSNSNNNIKYIQYTVVSSQNVQNNDLYIPFSESIKQYSPYVDPLPSNCTSEIVDNKLICIPNNLYSGDIIVPIKYNKDNSLYSFNVLILIKKLSEIYKSLWITEQNINKSYKIYTKIINDFNYSNSLSKLESYYDKNKSDDIYKYLFYNITKKNVIRYSKKNICLLKKFNIENIEIIKNKCKKYILFTKTKCIKIDNIKKIIIYNLIESLDKNTKLILKNEVNDIIENKYCIKKKINTENTVYYIVK